jgi:hypothetical protein
MIDSILSIVNKFIPDKDAANKLAFELEKETTKQMKMKSDIIQAEQANGSGKWRVRLMYLCMTMVSAHFIMYDIIPYIRTTFDFDFYTPIAPDNTQLWSFLKIGVGGYIGSRGVEKTMSWFKEKK